MSDDYTDLEKLLGSDETLAAPPAEQPVSPKADAPQQGDKSDASAPPAAAPVEAQEPALIPREALLDERRKRQELERRVADFERHMEQQRQQPAPQQRPDWMTDPDTAAQYMRAEIERNNFETRVHMSERMVADKHADYVEMRDVFAEAAVRNRALADELVKHPFPAEFAYQMGKRISLMNEIGSDPVTYKDRLRSEYEAEFRARYGIPEGSASPPAQQRASASAPVPKSLAKAPSSSPARVPNGQFVADHTSLEDILG